MKCKSLIAYIVIFFSGFITSTIVNWVNLFHSAEYYQILIDAILYNRKNKNLKIFAYVIMPNHFHMICRSDKLSEIILSIKSFSAKEIIKNIQNDNNVELLKLFEENKPEYKRKRKYQIWQEGFHPEGIISDEMLSQKIEYIHFNPVVKGWAKEPKDWVYSSAKYFYTGEQGVIPIDNICDE